MDRQHRDDDAEYVSSDSDRNTSECEGQQRQSLLADANRKTPDTMTPRKVIRWLLCPVVFMLCHWWLLCCPGTVLEWFPALWPAAGRSGPTAVLPPTPTTKVQVFDLGWQAASYAEHCNNTKEDELLPRCQQILKQAADVLGAERPLTPAQLTSQRDYMRELDGQRSISDRVLGFFCFVNIMWLVAIVGILATVGPCIAYLIGPFLLRYAKMFTELYFRPVCRVLHAWGVFEVLAYVLALLFSIQGSRYPYGADAGMMVALTGGLAFLPCWVYSTSLHTIGSGDQSKFLVLSHALVAAILVPLALIHGSKLIGFLAVLAVYGGLGFVFLAFGFGFLIGFDNQDAMQRCLIASVVLCVGLTAMRTAGLDPAFVRPFALGGMVLGNVMYFLALLILASGFRGSPDTYWMRQAAMASSLTLAVLVGSVYVIPAMVNTACTFLLLFLMEKQLEIQWNGFQVVVIFLNCVGLFFLSLWLHHHPQFIASMFDPTGIYA